MAFDQKLFNSKEEADSYREKHLQNEGVRSRSDKIESKGGKEYDAYSFYHIQLATIEDFVKVYGEKNVTEALRSMLRIDAQALARQATSTKEPKSAVKAGEESFS